MLYGVKNPHGGDCYSAALRLDFSSNVNPLGTPPGVIAAICDAAQRVAQYPDVYCRDLTAAIAAHENVPDRYIFCGAGAAELIYAYCDALRPVRVMELAPTFSEYGAAARHFGAQVLRHLLERNGGFAVDDSLLTALADEKPDVLFLCTPNNPTGRTIARPLLEAVLTLCRKQKTRVFLDECFLDFTDAKSASDLLAAHPNLLILKAFTKNYALAGARVGYCMVADSALLQRMGECVQPWNVSVLAQAAGAAALNETDWIQRAKALLPQERAYLTDGLTALGFTVFPSEANYLLFTAPAGLDSALLREKIAIRSCGNYAGLGVGWYRIAVRLREENEALLAAMQRVMEDTTWR